MSSTVLTSGDILLNMKGSFYHFPELGQGKSEEQNYTISKVICVAIGPQEGPCEKTQGAPNPAMEPREAVPRKWGREGGLTATRNLPRESWRGRGDEHSR